MVTSERHTEWPTTSACRNATLLRHLPTVASWTGTRNILPDFVFDLSFGKEAVHEPELFRRLVVSHNDGRGRLVKNVNTGNVGLAPGASCKSLITKIGQQDPIQAVIVVQVELVPLEKCIREHQASKDLPLIGKVNASNTAVCNARQHFRRTNNGYSGPRHSRKTPADTLGKPREIGSNVLGVTGIPLEDRLRPRLPTNH